jgi:dehydrogenase/reductase SDR family protein 12
MLELNEVIEVEREAHEVFAYVANFASCEEWDATAISARITKPGPISKGTEFEVVCALPVGSVTLIYTIVELEQDRLIKLLGVGRFFDVEDTITLSPTVNGTQLDYRAVFSFKGVVDSFVGPMEAGLRRMGAASVQQGLKRALEDDFPAPVLSVKNARADKLVLPGVSLFGKRGYRQGRKRWNPLSAYVADKHMVITGASAGLGLATAERLARMGAKLTLVVRDRERGRQLVDRLIAETGNSRLDLAVADLSLMGDTDSLVKSLTKSGEAIDVLINNAGALFPSRANTSEGLEQGFALLLLAPVRLTEGLKPLFTAGSRVINVVSGGMYTQKLKVDALQSEDGRYSGSVAYARLKRALVVKTEQWAEDWAKEGITVNSMHPGWADTPGVQSSLPKFHKVTQRILRSPEEGADTIVWLAAATEAGTVSGKLFMDREPRTTHLLKSTIETPAEREKLRQYLQLMAARAPTLLAQELKRV